MSESKKPRVYGYIRVSTVQQEESGLSIEAQMEKIKAYCMMKDLDLAGGVQEVASAKTLNRPGLQSILDKCRRREIDGIVILKLDRMFRSTKDALTTSRDLDKFGVALHSIQENLDTKSAMGRFFFTIMSAIGELEAGIISERTQMGLEAKAARGERMGQPPYGWTVVAPGSQELKPITEEQEITEHIVAMWRDKKPAREIAESLGRMGKVNRYGNPWSRENVNRLLRSLREVKPKQAS